jgi:predicted mannosyl-3-phosphoglycerate phosphatase (HAD superfamily)
MEDTILQISTSEESQEAKKLLKEKNINFVVVYSESKSHFPILFTNESAYAYRGLAQIKEYTDSL